MNTDSNQTHRLVTEDMLLDLPDPVKRYMDYTGVLGTPWPKSVHLKYTGRFRNGLERPWMPMSAQQMYTTDPPSFIWDARFKIFKLPLLRAIDEYKLGQAHMFAKLAGIITAFDVRSQELNQGAAVRFLSEMIWFPAAFLGHNITWQAVDPSSANVTFEDQGQQVSATMYFDYEGKVTNFVARRYRDLRGGFSLDTWSTPILEYGQMAGLNLPVRAEAVWILESGDLKYVEMKLTELHYNLSE